VRSFRVLRNVVTNYLRYFIGGLIGFLVTPVMVHLLGDGDYGLWVTVFSLTGYFGLVDQGIRPSLVRYVSAQRAAGDNEGLSRTLSSAIALYSVVGVLVVLATLVVSANFSLWFNITPDQVSAARTTVLLAGLSLALGFPFGVFGATLSGLQRYDIANWLGIVVGIVRALLFVWVLRAGGGIVGLAWTSLIANLLGHGLSFLFARRMLPGVRLAIERVDRASLRKIGSYSSIAFVGALANSITFQTDALVITGFLGAALVTPFALASGLVDQARSLVYSATFVLAPTASEMETLGEQEKLRHMMTAGSKYSVLVSWPVMAGLVIFGPNLLTTWVGSQYASAATLLTILTVPTFLSLPQSTASSLLFGISRHKGAVVISLLNAGFNLALSLLWVKPFGLTGVALGTAIPLVLFGGLTTALYACRVLGMPFGRYLVEGMVLPGLATLAFMLPALVLQATWRPMGWWNLAFANGACWILFAACAWRFALTADERARWGQMVPGMFGLSRPATTPAGGGS
jgi:O-antigen/teichoic acid export membrane protein